MSWRDGTAMPYGCCTTCSGTAASMDPETNGKCWDCYGTGHTHASEEACPIEWQAIVVAYTYGINQHQPNEPYAMMILNGDRDEDNRFIPQTGYYCPSDEPYMQRPIPQTDLGEDWVFSLHREFIRNPKGGIYEGGFSMKRVR